MTERATETSDRPNEVRFLIKEDEEAGYFGVCIERYIAAQGPTVELVRDRLRIAYRAELNESVKRTGEPFGGIPPAPDEYKRMFDTNAECVDRGSLYDIEIGPPRLLQIAA